MRKVLALRAAALVVTLAGAAAGSEPPAQVSRETPIVKAVAKARDSIVTIKGERRGGWGRKETVGTGVVIDARGYVVTNSHVIGSADRITVLLADGTELPATVFTHDVRVDMAVLQIKPTGKLTEMVLGPSGDLMVGETVVAIGHPFGYANTVSTGIVSGLGREIGMPSGEKLKDLVQISASINPGNSGGPLLNINGELIGINVAMREGAQNICFAIPTSAVQAWLGRVLSAKSVAKVSHGLTVTETVTAREGPDRQRVVVEAVAEKTPAAAAGLKPGDVLLKVGPRPLTNRFDVERALWELTDGRTLDVTVLRGGKEQVVRLEAPDPVTAVGLPPKD